MVTRKRRLQHRFVAHAALPSCFVALWLTVSPATARAEPAAAAPAPAPPSDAAARPPGTPPSGADVLAERGDRLVAEGRITEAITAYSDAIRLDAKNGAALLGLGKLRARLGEMNDAEALFTSATRQPSTAARAYVERAKLRRAVGREADAAADLELAASLSPDDITRAEEIARWHVQHRAWLPALAVWRRARAAAPDEQSEHRAAVQVRALTLLAAELDAAWAGLDPRRSWTRRALSHIARE